MFILSAKKFDNYLHWLTVIDQLQHQHELAIHTGYTYKYYSVNHDTREISGPFTDFGLALRSLPPEKRYRGVEARDTAKATLDSINRKNKKTNATIANQLNRLLLRVENFHLHYGKPTVEQINRGYL